MTEVATLIVGVVIFFIGIFITRAVFSIGKIVRLLEEIADSLAAREKSSSIQLEKPL